MSKSITPNPPGITVEQASAHCARIISGWKAAIRDAPFRTPSYEEHDRMYAPILEKLHQEILEHDAFLKKNGYYPWARKPKWVREREQEQKRRDKDQEKLAKERAKSKSKSKGKIPGINPSTVTRKKLPKKTPKNGKNQASGGVNGSDSAWN